MKLVSVKAYSRGGRRVSGHVRQGFGLGMRAKPARLSKTHSYGITSGPRRKKPVLGGAAVKSDARVNRIRLLSAPPKRRVSRKRDAGHVISFADRKSKPGVRTSGNIRHDFARRKRETRRTGQYR